MNFHTIISYFNLNKFNNKDLKKIRSVRINNEKTEFNSSNNPTTDSSNIRIVQISFFEQSILYLGTCIGVIFSSVITSYPQNSFEQINLTKGSIIISLVVSLVIIPNAFEKLILNHKGIPFLYKLGIFVQHGVFWHVILNSIGKVIS